MYKCPFTIIIDTAEQFAFDFQGMKTDSDQDYQPMEVQSIRQCLGRYPNSLGDYSLVGAEGRCHVERKSLEDFHGTVLGFSDGRRERFECELSNLSKLECPLVIVEANLDWMLQQSPSWGERTAQQNAKILFRSFISMCQDFRVQITFGSSRELAQLITFRHFYRFWEKNLKPKRVRKTKQQSMEVNSTPSLLDNFL